MAFHEHLQICRQCREHPFALCGLGRSLLAAAAPPQPRRFEFDREATVVLSLALRRLRLNERLDATMRAMADTLQDQFDRDLIVYNRTRSDV